MAARLSERSDRTVLLLEAGPDHDAAHTPAGVRGKSFLRAMLEPGRVWDGLVATRTAEQGPRPYARGRGAGGSSAVNAMVAIPGEPGDYDEWEAVYGCTGWAWADVAPWFSRRLLVSWWCSRRLLVSWWRRLGPWWYGQPRWWWFSRLR